MWIKAFQAAGEFYLYSAWTNAINRVSPRLYAAFAKESDLESSDDSRALGAALGLLPDREIFVQAFQDPWIQQALEQLQREGPARLILTVTEACNFRCRYCVFSGAYPYARPHGSGSMSHEVLSKALHWYFGFSRREFRIGFYGGEPLLKRRLIEAAVKEARRRVPPGAGLGFSMTTNGWLLDERTAAFLADNEFDLFISLDGPAQVHDRYRRTTAGHDTFRRIWNRVERIRTLHPDYFAEHVNFCVTLAPPDRVAETIEFIELNGDVFGDKVPIILTLEEAPLALLHALGCGACEHAANLAPLRERYLFRLVRGERPDGASRAASEASMTRLARRAMSSPSSLTLRAGQCIPGTRCHVTPDGSLHACERVDQHLPIGHIDTGYNRKAIEALLKCYADLVLAQCRSCWAVRLCRKCIADIAEGPKLSPSRLAAICPGRRRDLERDLIDYCRARSQNDRCFESLVASDYPSGCPVAG